MGLLQHSVFRIKTRGNVYFPFVMKLKIKGHLTAGIAFNKSCFQYSITIGVVKHNNEVQEKVGASIHRLNLLQNNFKNENRQLFKYLPANVKNIVMRTSYCRGAPLQNIKTRKVNIFNF